MIEQALNSAAKEIGMPIAPVIIAALVRYAEELLKWNRKINLTAITDSKQVAIKHFIDALVFAGHVNQGEMVLDIGSGAGIPGIPLAITRPDVKVVSVDAVAKKIQFQRHIARLLELENFEAVHTRVENLLEKHEQRFDLITSRAFSSLEQFVRLAAPLLKDGGRMIAMKGPASSAEISGSDDQLKRMGFKISTVVDYELPSGCGKRCLVFVSSCYN